LPKLQMCSEHCRISKPGWANYATQTASTVL
jgi:hypothetical protein